MLVSLWIVFLIVIISMVVRRMLSSSYNLSFQNYGKTDIPYITIDIQGRPFNFIVDTGCGMSIIASEFLDGIEFRHSQRQIQLSAITSDAINSNVVTIPINVRGKAVDEDFAVYGESDIANFQVHYGITIHGILGNEFFEKTGCQIDYKNHIVVFP